MARLSIGVERLGAEGFRLELGGGDDGPSNVVALAPGGGIRGRYEQDDAVIGLRSLRADTLALSEFSWRVAGGRVALAAPGRLTAVEIDASIGRGGSSSKFVGTIRAASLDATIDLSLGGVQVHAAAVCIQGFELIAGEDGSVAIRLGPTVAGSLKTMVGGLELVLSDIAAPGGLTVDPAGIQLETLSIGRAVARMANLALGSSQPKPSGGAGLGLAALPFLPHLCGHVNVDVVPDVTLPIIGTRKTTHAFRVGIEDGVIDFSQLEAGLSTLENLVIDFEVEGDKLILEKDIPLVPFDNKPLVEWGLDSEAQALAASKRVSLATLLRPQIPASARAQADKDRAKKGKAIDLRRLDVTNIDVMLRCGGLSRIPVGDGQIRLGDGTRQAVDELKLTGGLSHVPGQTTPGQLQLTAKGVHAALENLAVGKRALSCTELRVESIDDATVPFAGLKPIAVEAQLTGIHAQGLRLAPRQPTG